MKNVKCPVAGCGGFLLLHRGVYGAVQHHLWQFHGVDAITAHRMAAEVAPRPAQKRFRKSRAATRKPDEELERYLRKQMAFDF